MPARHSKRAREGDTHRAEIPRLFEREVRNDGRTRESDLSVTVNAASDLLRPRPWKVRVMDARTFRSEMLAAPGHRGQRDWAESFGTLDPPRLGPPLRALGFRPVRRRCGSHRLCAWLVPGAPHPRIGRPRAASPDRKQGTNESGNHSGSRLPVTNFTIATSNLRTVIR
jgi:hypothetical protein